MDWSPEQYEKFPEPRLRPARELLAHVEGSPETVYDLGCGAGQVTRLLAARWPEARIVGVDSSAAMLEKAASSPSSIEWVPASIESFTPAGADLVYSNAALHWVRDHDLLFPRLLRALRPGGTLAVQMPRSFDLPSHLLLREVLGSRGLDEAVAAGQLRAEVFRRPVESPETYRKILRAAGAAGEVWETEYRHELRGEDAVLDWMKGAGLRPVLEGLADRPRRRFLEEYRRRLRRAYPLRADGTVTYPFRRLFLVARVPG